MVVGKVTEIVYQVLVRDAGPKPQKRYDMRNRGEDEIRNELWRFAGHDLTQIDGISPTTAAIILTEMPIANSSVQSHMKCSVLSARVIKEGNPIRPSARIKTPARQATARLMAASRIMKAKTTASRGGITEVQFGSTTQLNFVEALKTARTMLSRVNVRCQETTPP